MKEEARFEYRLQSKPLSGRRMETPGTAFESKSISLRRNAESTLLDGLTFRAETMADGRGGERGDRGLCDRASRRASEKPRRQMDQMMTYHARHNMATVLTTIPGFSCATVSARLLAMSTTRQTRVLPTHGMLFECWSKVNNNLLLKSIVDQIVHFFNLSSTCHHVKLAQQSHSSWPPILCGQLVHAVPSACVKSSNGLAVAYPSSFSTGETH